MSISLSLIPVITVSLSDCEMMNETELEEDVRPCRMAHNIVVVDAVCYDHPFCFTTNR